MAITAVVFDLYGTLVDVDTDEAGGERWRTLASRLRRSGVDVDGSGVGLHEQYRELTAAAAAAGRSGRMLPWVFQQILQASGAEGSQQQVADFARHFRDATTRALELRDYAPRLLAELRSRGLRVGLLSNTEAIVTRLDLERVRLADRFDAVVLSSEVGSEKPGTGIYRVVLDRLGASPEQGVMVGDSWSTDVAGARLIGMRALHLDQHAASGTAAAAGDGVITVHPDLASIMGGLRALGVRVA